MGTYQAATRTRPIGQWAAGAIGAVFVVVGLLGFAVSGGHDAMGHEGGLLLGVFEVNLLHNLVHLAVGAALVVAAIVGEAAARLVSVVIGAVYLVVGLAGLFIAGGDMDLLALNAADNGLHLVIGAVLLVLGLRFGGRRAGR